MDAKMDDEDALRALLTAKLRSLGLAGVVAYGLLNTLCVTHKRRACIELDVSELRRAKDHCMELRCQAKPSLKGEHKHAFYDASLSLLHSHPFLSIRALDVILAPPFLKMVVGHSCFVPKLVRPSELLRARCARIETHMSLIVPQVYLCSCAVRHKTKIPHNAMMSSPMVIGSAPMPLLHLHARVAFTQGISISIQDLMGHEGQALPRLACVFMATLEVPCRQVPQGLGAAAAVRSFLTVFATVWAGSQVTKIARAAGALFLAPFVDRAMVRQSTRSDDEAQAEQLLANLPAHCGLCCGLFVDACCIPQTNQPLPDFAGDPVLQAEAQIKAAASDARMLYSHRVPRSMQAFARIVFVGKLGH
eukprot:90301-Pelagomonas_calceolata.AAC.4